MFKIGICDDGKNICASIEEMIFLYAKNININVDVEVWYSGEELCYYLEKNNDIDILFLDIELLEISGIQVAEFIRNKLDDRGMQIIYISGKASYAQRLFKTQPMDFLVKPISQQQVEEALALAIKILERRTTKFVFQKGKEYFYIPYREIIYFTSYGREIKIITKSEEHKFYGKLKDICNKLSEEFLVIHQSYVVNMEYVMRYTYEYVELSNGTVLTISKVHRKQVRQKLLRKENI